LWIDSKHITVSTGTAMAAGVLLQNELPYSSLLESSVYLANMSSGNDFLTYAIHINSLNKFRKRSNFP